MTTLHRWLTIVAVLVVLAFYAFLGTDGTFDFPLVSWQQSYYGSLSEGLLHGQLSMMHEPPPALAQLQDPYSWPQRKAARIPVLWDATYFEGKYYLYFSPVPAVLLYIPIRLVTGLYPSDALASTLLTSVAFLFFAMVLCRATPRSPHVPPWFWVLVAGLGNVVPYLLGRPKFYQMPLASSALFTGAFIYALLRFLESKSARAAAMMGLCLALAIASRPTGAMLLFVGIVVIFVMARRNVIAFLIPLAIIGAAVMLYNYARFHSPFEFGDRYQLNMARIEESAQCGVRSPAELLRLANNLVHYTAWTPAILGKFPYVEVQRARLDPTVIYQGQAERVSGVAAVTPFVLIGTAFALLLVLQREPLDPATRVGAICVLSGWLLLFGISSCRWATARYMLEFTLLLVVGSAICTERGLSFLESVGVRTSPVRIAIVILCALSIVAGLLLPFGRPPWI